jgi:DNA processing protein
LAEICEKMNELAYWMALAHLPKWGYKKLNTLIGRFHADHKITVSEFFHLDYEKWKFDFELSDSDIVDIQSSLEQLPNYSFLAESLISQGYEIVPIISDHYSQILKDNLKKSNSPTILYCKGDLDLMKKNSVAIVGSRNASNKSLEFTDNITQKVCSQNEVVVSGFAKGVDKQALDSAIKYNGDSIIVLPQGILTFGTGIKAYYKNIIHGEVLVVSTFFPKSPWNKQLAMARNPIIYGMAKEIFVAESGESGGTWSGVMDGLRKNRKIYVRVPTPGENNANGNLLNLGALPVDHYGNVCEWNQNQTAYKDELEEKLNEILKDKPRNISEIMGLLVLEISANELKKKLKGYKSICVIKLSGSKVDYYKLNQEENNLGVQQSLF